MSVISETTIEMSPSQSQPNYDSVSAKVMSVGIARYFTQAELSSIVDVIGCLNAAADRFEEFLIGEGKGSDISDFLDDLDIAGLRSAAPWVPEGTQMIGKDLYELFGIATSGNCRPGLGQRDAEVYEHFENRVKKFVEEYKIRI